MTAQSEFGNPEQLTAAGAELQTMADLIEKYPAEAQLIMGFAPRARRGVAMGR